MFVHNIMIRDVPTVGPALSLRDAAAAMREARVRLAVVTDEGRILGVLTPRELVLGGEAEVQLGEKLDVGDVVNRRVTITREQDTIEQLASELAQSGARRAVVVDESGVPSGVVSALDVAKRERRRRRIREAIDRASDASFPASDPPSWTGSVAG